VVGCRDAHRRRGSGRLKREPEVELAERYREHAVKSGRGIGLRSLDIVEIAESQARDAQRRMLQHFATPSTYLK
jgi:hypothetical protein